MKVLKKINVCILSILFVLIAFSGCVQNSEVNRVSKKLSTYEIEAELDDENKIIVASMSLKYVNNTDDTLTKLWFHLYPNAFSENTVTKPYSASSKARCFPNGENFGYIKVNRVSSSGLELKNEIIGEDKQILEVLLPKSLEASKSVCIDIEFEVKLSKNTHRLGFFENEINLGNWYPIVCVYENGEFDGDSYYDIGDPFYSECANYIVNLKYPEKYCLATTGVVKSEEILNGTKSTKIVAKAVRDYAMVLGSNYSELTERVGDTTINIFAYRGDDLIYEYMQTAKKALIYFNETFGRYPYDSLSVVFTNFMQGGMEYPELVMISDSLVSESEKVEVIVHEIAHQWWYGVVGNDEVSESYLDESLAEYSTLLFYENHPEYNMSKDSLLSEAKKNYLLYKDVAITTRDKFNDKINLNIYEYNSEYEYVYMIYVKGKLMIDDLRNLLGEDTFLRSIKRYYIENKFKNSNTEIFISAFENESNIELHEFIYSWLNGNVEIN